MDERKEERETQSFVDDINFFLAKDEFTIHDFHERVLTGLKQKSTFKMMVWGDDPEVKVLENQNKICSAMYDEEKTDLTLLSREAKKEICETIGLEMSDIADVFQKFS